MASVNQSTNAMNVDAISKRELRALLAAAQADLVVLRAAIKAITAKLDADAGVTDTNYASTCDPAALTFTS